MDRKLYKQVGELYEKYKGTQWDNTQSDNRDKCIYANLPMAIKTALRYQGMGIEEEDLIGCAFVGVCTAYDKYKPINGIQAKLLEMVENNCTPEEFSKAAKINYTIDNKDAMRVWVLTNTKSAKFSSIIYFWVKAAVLRELKSVNAMKYVDELDKNIADIVEDEDSFEELVANIPEEWLEALYMRYGLGYEAHTLKDISSKLGISIAETKGRIRGAIAMIRDNKKRRSINRL